MNNPQHWTLIWAWTDAFGVTSVQQVISSEDDPEAAARAAYAEHTWLAHYELIAAVRGASEIKVRDDARTQEFGLE